MTHAVTPSTFKRAFIGDDAENATKVPAEDIFHVAGRYGAIFRISSTDDADTITYLGEIAMTAGSINGVTVGGTTPAPGTFTTLGSTGTTTLGSGSANYLTVAGAGSSSNPVVAVVSGDTDTGLTLTLKGNGIFNVRRQEMSAATLSADSSGQFRSQFKATTSNNTGTITSGVATNYGFFVNGDTADAWDATARNLYGMFVGTQFGGTGMRGGRIGLGVSYAIVANTSNVPASPTLFQMGFSSTTVAAGKDGGTSNTYNGHLFAGFYTAELRAGGKFWDEIKANEFNISADLNSSVSRKFGLTITLATTDATPATIEEAYIVIGSKKANASASHGLRTGLLFGGNSGYWGIPPGGAIIEATATTVTGGTPPPMSAAYGIDFSKVEFFGGLLRGPGLLIDQDANIGTAATNAGAVLQTRSTVVAKTAVVASVTVLDGGAFTDAPTLVFATDPYGSGATAAVATMGAIFPRQIISGGSGHAVDDVLTFVGGTFGVAATAVVTAVSAGSIADIRVTSAGDYTVLPSSPISVTSSGSGTGGTFSLAWTILTVTLTAPGSGYSEFPRPALSATTNQIRPPRLICAMTATQVQLHLNDGLINVAGIPTSSAGLSAGDLWNDSGTLKVA